MCNYVLSTVTCTETRGCHVTFCNEHSSVLHFMLMWMFSSWGTWCEDKHTVQIVKFEADGTCLWTVEDFRVCSCRKGRKFVFLYIWFDYLIRLCFSGQVALWSNTGQSTLVQTEISQLLTFMVLRGWIPLILMILWLFLQHHYHFNSNFLIIWLNSWETHWFSYF